MDWSRVAACVVDVHRVDAHEFDAHIPQIDRRIFREKRMVLEVLIGAPMFIPAGMDQHGFIAKFQSFKGICIHGETGAMIGMDDDPIQVGEMFDLHLR